MRDMNVDTDVNNYTVSDLLIILDLDEVNSDDITEKTDFYINKFNDENNREMASFFQDVQNTLLEYAYGLEDENPDTLADTTHARKQSEKWWKERKEKRIKLRKELRRGGRKEIQIRLIKQRLQKKYHFKI